MFFGIILFFLIMSKALDEDDFRGRFLLASFIELMFELGIYGVWLNG